MSFKVGDIVTLTEKSSGKHLIYHEYVGKPIKITRIYSNEEGELLINGINLISNKPITPCFISRLEFLEIKEEDVL